MIELPLADLHRVGNLFTTPHLTLVIDAMIAGNTPATAWADDPRTPRTALVWDGGHCLYVAGPADPRTVRETVDQEIIPRAPDLLKIETPDETPFAGLDTRRQDRILYRATRNGSAHDLPPLPPGFRVSEISANLATLRTLANAVDMIAEIESCWPSLDTFRAAGLGYAAHDTDTIATWCTAEYVSHDKCGIGIETIRTHQRRGLATNAASAFLAHAAARRLTAHWDARTDNLPSVRIAEKLGLTEAQRYPALIVSTRPQPPTST